MQGKAEESGSHFDAAERLFGPRPAPLDLGNLRTDQARRCARLGRAEDSERLAREALDALGRDYPRERGEALAVLADALAQRADAEADTVFRQATELLEEHGHAVELTDAYRAWARFLRASGRESEALDVLDRATELSASTRAPSRT
jgi:tetratricopeptide (TPR) repeat protein